MKSKLKRIGFWKETSDDPVKRKKEVEQYIGDYDKPGDKESCIRFCNNAEQGPYFKGWANCRICGKKLGSCDMINGGFIFPVGLVHYIKEHGIVMGDNFVKAARRSK